MKSIRKRMLSLSLICVVVANLIIISIGIVDMIRTVDEDSEELIRQIAEENVHDIDAQLVAVEQAVTTMQDYILALIREDPDFWLDEESTEAHLAQVHELTEIFLQDTSGARSMYYHLAASIDKPDTGIYVVKMSTGQFVDFPITDVSQYGEEDTAEVGWYYQPLEAGTGIWMLPYENGVIDHQIITYAVPVIYEDQEIGVVGIDVDLSLVTDMVSSIELYDSGYAFLLDPDGNIVYHKEYPDGISQEDYSEAFQKANRSVLLAQSSGKLRSYRWNGRQKKVLFSTLRNGLSLGITVPTREIHNSVYIFVVLSIISFAISVAIAYAMSARVSGVLVRPLQELTQIAQRLAQGDLDVSVHCETNDEVEVLANSIQEMANELKKHVADVNTFARTDALTGAWNKAAYEEKVSGLEKQIQMDCAEFSVAVLDVNNLKVMNDTYGHEVGDLWITGAANAILHAFGKSRVYRIGGDEFAVLFEPNARKNYEYMCSNFYQELEKFNAVDRGFKEKLMIAIGIADYDKKADSSYGDVFCRADSLMYKNKKHLKGLDA